MRWFKKPEPLVLYKRVEPLVWTKADASAWTAIMGSAVFKKVESFMHDKVVNGHLAGGDKQLLKGILYGLKLLEGFKGVDTSPEKSDPKDLSPIQFFDE